jgi:hypothetical protein
MIMARRRRFAASWLVKTAAEVLRRRLLAKPRLRGGMDPRKSECLRAAMKAFIAAQCHRFGRQRTRRRSSVPRRVPAVGREALVSDELNMYWRI